MEWISVNDRLPELVKDVLAFSLNGYGVEKLLFDGDGRFYHEETDTERLVTYWMYLPEPPKNN